MRQAKHLETYTSVSYRQVEAAVQWHSQELDG